MTIENPRELENTKRKLALLEAQYEKAEARDEDNPRVRELTLRSLRRFSNKLREEIARYEAHALEKA